MLSQHTLVHTLLRRLTGAWMPNLPNVVGCAVPKRQHVCHAPVLLWFLTGSSSAEGSRVCASGRSGWRKLQGACAGTTLLGFLACSRGHTPLEGGARFQSPAAPLRMAARHLVCWDWTRRVPGTGSAGTAAAGPRTLTCVCGKGGCGNLLGTTAIPAPCQTASAAGGRPGVTVPR